MNGIRGVGLARSRQRNEALEANELATQKPKAEATSWTPFILSFSILSSQPVTSKLLFLVVIVFGVLIG